MTLRLNVLVVALVVSVCGGPLPRGAAEPVEMQIWPGGRAPGDDAALAAERDTTTGDDPLVAGRRVARIGNVATPTIALFRPAAEKANGAAIVICPGGGHHILAYDLEGTEVAAWANSLGFAAIVLKYRVPARDNQRRWLAAVQDAQRAMRLVRTNAEAWKLDPKRIGILGFSAGGETAARTALAAESFYARQDATDDAAFRPDFAVLVYPAGLVEKDKTKLRDDVRVTAEAPPMFLVHAFDDRTPVENSLLLYLALKRVEVPAELHAYASGGHGFGLRKTDEPITAWPEGCADWLRSEKLLQRRGP